jgi:hypothetical protein
MSAQADDVLIDTQKAKPEGPWLRSIVCCQRSGGGDDLHVSQASRRRTCGPDYGSFPPLQGVTLLRKPLPAQATAIALAKFLKTAPPASIVAESQLAVVSVMCGVLHSRGFNLALIIP